MYILRCKKLNFLPLNTHLHLNDPLLFHKIFYKMSTIKLPSYLHLYQGGQRLRLSHLDELSIVSDIQPTAYKCENGMFNFSTFENS